MIKPKGESGRVTITILYVRAHYEYIMHLHSTMNILSLYSPLNIKYQTLTNEEIADKFD